MRKVASSSEHSLEHKHTRWHSLMARKYRLYSRLHRLAGCFFIRGMLDGTDQAPTRVVWKSWYTLYSCGLIGVGIWLDVNRIIAVARHAAAKGKVEAALRAAVQSILLARMIVNYLYATLRSSKLLAFHLRASAFERSIGMTSSKNNITRNLFWSDARHVILGLACCLAYTFTLSKLPPYDATTDMEGSPLAQVCYWLKMAFVVIVHYVYDRVYTVALRCACEVLEEYIRGQLRVLKTCLRVQDVQSLRCTATARGIESVRLNVAAIRRLKEEVNDIWGLPLVLSSFCLVVVVSAGVYEICRQDASVTQLSSVLLYMIWLSCSFVQLASASQSLTNAVKEIKDFCTGVGGIDDSYFGRQIEDLHDYIQPEAMSLKGGNFFRLNMSALVSMGAAVVTYTVILVQTNRSLFMSRNETAAVHDNFV